MGRFAPGRSRRRDGAALLYTTATLTVAAVLLVYAVDVAHQRFAREELQASAEAAALTAAWELFEQRLAADRAVGRMGDSAPPELAEPQPFGRLVDLTGDDRAEGEVLLGRCESEDRIVYDQIGDERNSVTVRLRNAAADEGWAAMLPRAGNWDAVEASAAFDDQLAGLRCPPGANLELLPLALDGATWRAALAGEGEDRWSWNEELGRVEPGPDGLYEFNLAPENAAQARFRGPLDFGASVRAAAETPQRRLARQALHGLTRADLESVGGALRFRHDAELSLRALSGASLRSLALEELPQIQGLPRIVPVVSQASHDEQGGRYVVERFAGLRIMHVRADGNVPRILAQPAAVVTAGVIRAETGQRDRGDYVYSPPRLIGR